jgi:AraC-like DNA-binding protein
MPESRASSLARRPVSRRRSVRYRYPAAMMELAVLLAARSGKQFAAQLLRLPLSTVYRWHVDRRGAPVQTDTAPDALLAACSARGFNVEAAAAILGLRLPAEYNAGVGSIVQPKSATVSDDAAKPQRCAGNEDARIAAARKQIDRCYYARLSCQALATSAHMTKWHFIRTFGALVGASPYNYLMQVRVAHAKRLLRTTPHSLQTVAAAVGFDSPSSLCRAFVNVEGIRVSDFCEGLRLGHASSPLHGGGTPSKEEIDHASHPA